MQISLISASHRKASQSKRVADIFGSRLKVINQSIKNFDLDLG